MRIIFSIMSLALAAGLTTSQIIAQNTPQDRRVMAPTGPPQTMDLAVAKKLVAVAEAAAEAVNEHVAICVMDTNGDVVLSERMDGVGHIPVATAQGKARSVLLFGIPSAEIAEAMRNKKPISVTLKALPVGTGGGEIALQRGGLPVMKDGNLIGAIGVGGSASGNDVKFSQAGIDAITAK